ncbi:MAG: carbohydrate ABC transporter substrate-binding protein [Limnochordaceae bacterium]|nr:carbohydrate ABC transporter substrate-binding protein [Limnochordaceae bacterium]
MVGAQALAARTVTMLGTWGGQELEAFRKVLEPFEKETGIRVEFTGTRDLPAVLTTRVQAGNPPDLAALPNPGQMREFAREGHLVDLSKALDVKVLRQQYAPVWLDLGSYDGKLYAIFMSADLKSLVWYSPKAFAAKGYAVPKTWDEMMALSDRIVKDGGTPWAIGLESGAASGWPGTDWIEDIMLRTAGPEVYDKWVAHQIPWTDPAVRRAWETFGKIALNPKYVYGGPTGELTTNFGDSVNALFTSPPRAYMHRQATFIQSFILKANPGLKAGTDYDFFALPPIDPKWGTPALGAADMVGMFKDSPEARMVIQYLASPKAQERWVAALGKLSANKAVSMNAYPDPLTRKAAKILVDAQVFRFDGSDLMPAAVGSGSFWTGILDYVGGEDLDSVLEKIERSAEEAYR